MTALKTYPEQATPSPGVEPEPDTKQQPNSNPDASLVGEAKARYIVGMFSRIARRYDLMNAIMSLGQDARWRSYTVRQARPKQGDLALDVACGTGRIAQLLSRKGAKAVGVDFTLAMMLQGRRDGVGSHEPVYFAGADALRLPFADNTFDCVTTGFAMRNVTDIEQAFREMRRVVKPGGRVVCLEVGRPTTRLTRFGHAVYTRFVVPSLGKLISGDADAYTYLPNSMRKFPSPPQLAALMRRVGIGKVAYRQFMLGAAAVHYGEKPAGGAA